MDKRTLGLGIGIGVVGTGVLNFIGTLIITAINARSMYKGAMNLINENCDGATDQQQEETEE